MKHHVAAGDPATAQAARVLLEAGGNAFDAAVAAMFTAMVAEPTLTSAGGGGSLMACPAQGAPVCFDFFVDMPSGQPEGPLDFEGVWADYGTTRQEFQLTHAALRQYVDRFTWKEAKLTLPPPPSSTFRNSTN